MKDAMMSEAEVKKRMGKMVDAIEKENPSSEVKVTDTVFSDDDPKAGLSIKNTQNDFMLPMQKMTFVDEADRKRFVKKVESIIHATPEYNDWVDYVRNELRLNKCVITDEISDNVKIEIHHHPICLFTIVSGLINLKLESGVAFNSMTLAFEVMKLHYENKVGYVALCTTMHQKFNNHKLDIPISLCAGNYKALLTELSFSKQEKERIDKLMLVNKTNQKAWCGQAMIGVDSEPKE